ncbi:hypothetical protein B0H67DRAFT_608086 [Lasiosphaeris hirsuta]|uniref:Protein kinase domain-containing protein n=1 Tax=Lasiosphaeris hirsuta TaxID=260670 RepID=A0AA40B229_9PEZI|nr:hypothetical protein B0H67DRAFT_608086 [Lasiosphaeris hirsuta]
MLSSVVSFGRSVLALPGASDALGDVIQVPGLRTAGSRKQRSRTPPPGAQRFHRSTISSKAPTQRGARIQYDEVVLLQWLATQNELKAESPLDLGMFPITGKGRIFTVRRFPTGWGEDQAWLNFNAPAAAVKSLSAAPADTPDEEKSLQYRSIVQELRILLHGSLREHVNFVRIQSLGWEPDPYRPREFLPNLFVEFAKFGTMGTFLENFESTYAWKQRMILDVVEAVAALHACGIAHSDIKLDNILLFPCEDAKFPVVAKLSDFGFSVDLAEAAGLVGLTPVWAAPEVLHGEPDMDLAQADVYSLGFVIWAIAAAGATLFESSCSADPETSIETWTMWKDTNELVSMAVGQMHALEHLPHDTDVEEICLLLDATLQRDPAERRLQVVLNCLRGQCARESRYEPGAVPPVSIAPFDPNEISVPMPVFRTGWMTTRLRLQISRRLEAIAQAHPLPVPDRHCTHAAEEDISEWRVVKPPADRATGAAFLLGQLGMEGFPETCIETACYWLNMAAERGHMLSKTLVATFAHKFQLQDMAYKTRPWLRLAACHGSKPALRLLRQVDAALHSEAIRVYRGTFWASSYNIPADWMEKLAQPTDLDWLATRGSGVRLGDWDCSPLQCSAMLGAPLAVRAVLSAADPLDRKAMLDEQNSRGDTALVLACRSGHAAIARILLEAGASAQIGNVDGENGLHWLASLDDADVFDVTWALLAGGAELHKFAHPDGTFISPVASAFYHNVEPGTPLHRAVAVQSLAAIQALLQLGASTLIACDGWTPLSRAASLRRADIVKLLLDETPHSHDLNTLHRGSRSTLASALSYTAKLRLQYSSPQCDVGQALADVYSLLLQAGAKVSDDPGRPVARAIMLAEHAALDLLVRRDPKSLQPPQAHGGPITLPVLQAVLMEDVRALEIVIRAGASPFASVRFGSTGVKSALHHCRWHNDSAVTQKLLSCGLDPNEAGDPEASDTPLLYALVSGYLDLAGNLLDSGATLTKQNPGCIRGNVLGEFLYLVPNASHLRSLEWLVARPRTVFPLYTDPSKGLTVFHSICQHTQIRTKFLRASDFQAVFNLLRRVFPDPKVLDLQDANGYTALHYATANVNPTAVEALLQAGADPRIKCSAGRTELLGFQLWLFQGTTPLEIVEQDALFPIPDGFHLTVRDRAFWIAQRERVKMLLYSDRG